MKSSAENLLTAITGALPSKPPTRHNHSTVFPKGNDSYRRRLLVDNTNGRFIGNNGGNGFTGVFPARLSYPGRPNKHWSSPPAFPDNAPHWQLYHAFIFAYRDAPDSPPTYDDAIALPFSPHHSAKPCSSRSGEPRLQSHGFQNFATLFRQPGRARDISTMPKEYSCARLPCQLIHPFL